MSTTALIVYNDVCQVLMEPNPPGLSLGVVTNDMFFKALGSTIQDILEKTGIVKDLYDIAGISGTSVYAEPTELGEAVYASYADSYLYRDSGFSMDQSGNSWFLDSGEPNVWREDELPISQIQISPTPNFNGTLQVIGTTIPVTLPAVLSDTIPLIPDSLIPYVKYGVLYRLFLADSENKDISRSEYMKQRYEEGISIAASFCEE